MGLDMYLAKRQWIGDDEDSGGDYYYRADW